MIATLDEVTPVVIEETLAGTPGIVDLWCFFPGDVEEAALRAAYDGLLSEGERERCGRLRREPDRRTFVATRALVRTALSAYAPVAPESWRFVAGAHGKPCIAPSPQAPPLYFNASNTLGLVTCAVSVAHRDVGTDAERLDLRVDAAALANRWFTAEEAAALSAMPPDRHGKRFLSSWTLKESYVKARGGGLTTIPLDEAAFLLDDRGEVGVIFHPRRGEDARRWRFASIDAPPMHVLAVGVDTGGVPLSLRATRCVPALRADGWRAARTR